MSDRTNHPKFTASDRAECWTGGTAWVPVRIKSNALRWVSSCEEGNVYLVKYVDPGERERLLVKESWLRPTERWVRCEGLHRSAGDSIAPMVEINKGHPGPWERLETQRLANEEER